MSMTSSSSVPGRGDETSTAINKPPTLTTRQQQKVIVIAGSTGVGKSDVAAILCDRLKGMIVSADSVQAYQGVSIGANKPTLEERTQTPHFLVDVAGPHELYNAADWTRDANFTIQTLLSTTSKETPQLLSDRQQKILKEIEAARRAKGYKQQPILPVVVGGTMMYLQWLVHGRPADSVKPTPNALQQAAALLQPFQTEENYPAAVALVSNKGPLYKQQIEKTLQGKDWYRLRRILEVALTVEEQQQRQDGGGGCTTDSAVKIYTGQREGGLLSWSSEEEAAEETAGSFDVRCFFLCPNDRMKHTKTIDERCERMIQNGLLQETTDLATNNQLPDMVARAIGYRQVIDYLQQLQQQLIQQDDDDDKKKQQGQLEKTDLGEGADSKRMMSDSIASSFQNFLDVFTTATRQYAKKQMQWFRRDAEFFFIPVDLSLKDKETRVQQTARQLERLIQLSRTEYDHERLANDGLSVQTRRVNEEQGPSMKFYQFQRFLLKPGSDEAQNALTEAIRCAKRFRYQPSTTTTTTVTSPTTAITKRPRVEEE